MVKMKAIILLFLLLPLSLFSQRTYSPNQTVYCWAKSGLNLRNQPNTQGAKITKVPFKGVLTVVDSIKGISYLDTLTKDKNHPLLIKGNWIKVAYKNDTGYVFDGYISRIPVETFFDYFEKSLVKNMTR